MRWFATAVLWIAIALLAGYFLTTVTWASDPQIDKLLEQVRNLDVEQRVAAIRELSRQNTLEAFKAMLLAVYATDERERFELERGLNSFNDPQTMEWLGREGIAFPDKWVRFYCVDAYLQNRGPAGVPAAVAGIEKNYPEVQLLILERLVGPNLGRSLSDEKVIEAVGSVLHPGQLPQVWLKAVEVLDAANQPKSAETLVSAIEEREGWPPRGLISMVQNALARGQSLGLADRLRGTLKTVKGPAAKIGALMGLGHSGEESGLQALLEFLKEEKDPELRAGAISALGACPLLASDKALVDIAGNVGMLSDALMAASVLIEKSAGPALDPLKAVAENSTTDFRLKGLLADLLRRVRSLETPPSKSTELPESPLVPDDARASRRALAWLVRNQEEDGHWSASKHNPYHGKHGFPHLYAEDADDYLDVAVTSWCMLALEANENHPLGGPFAESVRRATQWLLAHQNANGLFKADKEAQLPQGGNPDFAMQTQHIWAMNHLSATLALLEGSFQAIMSWKGKNPPGAKLPEELSRLDDAVEKAIDAITSKLLPGEYKFFEPKLVNLPRIALISTIRYSYLKRAKALDSKEKTFDKTVQKFTLDSLNKIAESATTVKVPFDRNGNYWFRSYGSSAEAISAAIYLTPEPPKIGEINLFDFISQRLELLRKHPPRWNPFYAIVGPTKHPPADLATTGPEAAASSIYSKLGLMPTAWKDDVVNFEYWFWATNSCFVRGEEEWDGWKDMILPVLLKHQSLAGANFGSWDPEGPNERVWGRCLSTAQGALMMLLPRKILNIHTVMWHRIIPKNFIQPLQKPPLAGTEPKKDGDKGDEKKDEKKDEKMEKMEHPTKKPDEEKKG